jgi:hypothetical protein
MRRVVLRFVQQGELDISVFFSLVALSSERVDSVLRNEEKPQKREVFVGEEGKPHPGSSRVGLHFRKE